MSRGGRRSYLNELSGIPLHSDTYMARACCQRFRVEEDATTASSATVSMRLRCGGSGDEWSRCGAHKTRRVGCPASMVCHFRRFKTVQYRNYVHTNRRLRRLSLFPSRSPLLLRRVGGPRNRCDRRTTHCNIHARPGHDNRYYYYDCTDNETTVDFPATGKRLMCTYIISITFRFSFCRCHVGDDITVVIVVVVIILLLL